MLIYGDSIVVLGTATGRGRKTGVRLEVPFAHVWVTRDHQIVEFRQYIDPVRSWPQSTRHPRDHRRPQEAMGWRSAAPCGSGTCDRDSGAQVSRSPRIPDCIEKTVVVAAAAETGFEVRRRARGG